MDSKKTDPPALQLAQFVPFRLNRLAVAVSEHLAAIYRERFGLDIPEWRVMATVGPERDDRAASDRAISEGIPRSASGATRGEEIPRSASGATGAQRRESREAPAARLGATRDDRAVGAASPNGEIPTGGGYTAQYIADSTRMHKTRVSRAIAHLEERGLMTRVTSTEDRREMELRLTKAGRRMYEELVPLALERERALLACMSNEALEGFLSGLDGLEASLGLR